MKPDLLKIFIVFLRLGAVSFGASALQILLEEICGKRKWMTEAGFRENFAMANLSPGPFHVNLVLKIGYELGGTAGMLSAFTGFTLPSFLLLTALISFFPVTEIASLFHGHTAIFRGLFAAISALVLSVAARMLSESLKKESAPLSLIVSEIVIIFCLALLMIFFQLSPFLAILAGGTLFLMKSSLLPVRK